MAWLRSKRIAERVAELLDSSTGNTIAVVFDSKLANRLVQRGIQVTLVSDDEADIRRFAGSTLTLADLSSRSAELRAYVVTVGSNNPSLDSVLADADRLVQVISLDRRSRTLASRGALQAGVKDLEQSVIGGTVITAGRLG